METYVGFDSAWTDNPKAPGAVCAIQFDREGVVCFHEPRLARFAKAEAFIRRLYTPGGLMLIGVDQPTIVPNNSGMRPAERVVASAISWVGGGVQPANRGKATMFGDDAPIWTFLDGVGAIQDPEAARVAPGGLFLIEVFPALALLAWNDAFYAKGKGPKYNPANQAKFCNGDWSAVSRTAASVARRFGCEAVALWCDGAARLPCPEKADQDRLDAIICALVALFWRRGPRAASVFIGDLKQGYVVSPASEAIRERLLSASLRLARERGVNATVA
jgi:predicted RNase H-like nuclease